MLFFVGLIGPCDYEVLTVNKGMSAKVRIKKAVNKIVSLNDLFVRNCFSAIFLLQAKYTAILSS